MRIADKVLLYAFAFGSVALASGLIAATEFFIVHGYPKAAIASGLLCVWSLPLAFYSAVMEPSLRSVRSYNLDLGGLDPETYFNENTAEGASIRHSFVRPQRSILPPRPQVFEAAARSALSRSAGTMV
jgi:hypothetical protein